MTEQEEPRQDKPSEPLEILSLRVKNYMRIELAEIHPNGDLVVLKGPNGAGKSTILNAIPALLSGKRFVGEEPLKQGKETGDLSIDIGPRGGPTYLTAKRSLSKDGDGKTVIGDLRLRRADGPIKAGQSMLDTIKGDLSFDPEAFRRMVARERREQLLSVVGLNFNELDKKAERVFAARTEVGRAQKKANTLAIDARPSDGAESWDPEEPLDLTAPKAAVEAARGNESAAQLLAEKARTACQLEASANTVLEAADRRVIELTAEVEAAVAHVAELQNISDDRTATARQAQEAAEGADPAMMAGIATEKQGTLDTARATNTARQQVYEKEQRLIDLTRMSNEQNDRWATLTKQLSGMDKEKRDALAAAVFPVEGLGVNEGDVIFEGLPFDQAAESVQIRVSVAMAMALAPDLRVCLIRHGSALDPDQIAMIRDLVAEKEGQVWIEMVYADEEQEGIVVVADGRASTERDASSPEDSDAPEPADTSEQQTTLPLDS